MNKSVKSINPCKSVVQTSYDIVKAHGGLIDNISNKDKGTEFIISIPLNK